MDSAQVAKTSQDIDSVAKSMGLSEAQVKQLKSAIKSEGRSRRMGAAEIEAKYPHVIKGSVRFDAIKNKQVATITCTDPEDKGCEATREVFTSDLFQVSTCEGCKSAARKATRDAQKKLLADFKAKQLAAKPEADAEVAEEVAEEVEAE
jgi:hypothetical protein